MTTKIQRNPFLDTKDKTPAYCTPVKKQETQTRITTVSAITSLAILGNALSNTSSLTMTGRISFQEDPTSDRNKKTHLAALINLSSEPLNSYTHDLMQSTNVNAHDLGIDIPYPTKTKDLSPPDLIKPPKPPQSVSYLLDALANYEQGPVRALATPAAAITVSLAVGALTKNPYGVCLVGASIATEKAAEKLETYLPKDKNKVVGYTMPYFDGPFSGQEIIPITAGDVSQFLKFIKIPGEFFRSLIKTTTDSFVFGAEQVGISDQNIYTAWDYTQKTGATVKETIEALNISQETLQTAWDSVVENMSKSNSPSKTYSRQLPPQGSRKFSQDPIKTDMIMRFEKMNIDPSYAHLESDTKRYLAERFAGSWVHEDKTAEIADWAKNVINKTDPKYSHLDESTRKNIVYFTIDGSINKNASADEAARLASRLATGGYED